MPGYLPVPVHIAPMLLVSQATVILQVGIFVTPPHSQLEKETRVSDVLDCQFHILWDNPKTARPVYSRNCVQFSGGNKSIGKIKSCKHPVFSGYESYEKDRKNSFNIYTFGK